MGKPAKGGRLGHSERFLSSRGLCGLGVDGMVVVVLDEGVNFVSRASIQPETLSSNKSPPNPSPAPFPSTNFIIPSIQNSEKVRP